MPDATNWGKKMTFGNLMAEFSNGGGGWVHDVSFSASGEKLAWVGHDSSVSVAVASADGSNMNFVKTQYLPFLTLTWVTENNLIAAGHDCVPMLFGNDDSGAITFLAKLEDTNKGQTTQKFSALKHFKALDSRATTQEDNVTNMSSLHQNSITQVSIHSGHKGSCTKLSSAGTDGQLVTWDIKSLESSVAGLRI